MATHYFHWGSGASGNVCTECFGLFRQKPSSFSLMPVHQMPNFTKLSKEESVTVSVTESVTVFGLECYWIQSGEQQEKQVFCHAHKASGISKEKLGVSALWIWGSLLV